MRSDIAHVANMSHHGSTRVSKKYGGRVRYIPDPEHSYDDEVGGIHPDSRRRDWMNINRCPIVGFLHKNLGRPWNEVYSEFCAVNDSRSLLGREMRKAITAEVNIGKCYEGADGVVYEYRAGIYCVRSYLDKESNTYKDIPNPKYYAAQDTPVDGYYVHPRTGLLWDNADYTKNGKRKRYSYRDPFAYTRKQEPEVCDRINLDYGYVTEKSWWGGSFEKRACTEWYSRELVGRRPRSRFYAWFHHITKTTYEYYWERVDGSRFAKNAHFDGVEVSPYVDPKKEAYYKIRPEKYQKKDDGFWYVRKENKISKTVKTSCNHKQMAWIREYLAK